MIKEFNPVTEGITALLGTYEKILTELDVETFYARKNSQNRTIKQILGHMIDSASNNTHRIIHLQYREGPVEFPNYATHGNNDHWIAIQDYQHEEWKRLLILWKATHLHIIHVIKNIDPDYLSNKWIAAPGEFVTLKEMVIDFFRHFKLHLSEIDEMISRETEF